MATNVTNWFTDPAQRYNDVIFPQKDQHKRDKDWGNYDRKTAHAEKVDNTPTKELSPAAQKLLDRLKKTYDNVDFMVAGSANSAEAKAMLANGSGKYSVLFTNEELEKMASDEGYQKQMLDKMHEGFQTTASAAANFGTNPNGDLRRVSVTYNSDGTTSMFAEMEKSMDAQKALVEKLHEKRAQEKTDYNNGVPTRRVGMYASNLSDLMKKMQGIDN